MHKDLKWCWLHQVLKWREDASRREVMLGASRHEVMLGAPSGEVRGCIGW